MKPAYVICALLSVAIGTTRLVLAENGIEAKSGPTQPPKSIVPPNLAAVSKTITDATTAEPADPSNNKTTQNPNITTSSPTTTTTKPPTLPITTKPTTTPTTAVPDPKPTTSNTTTTTTSTTTPTSPTTSHIPTSPPSSTAVPGTTDASKTTAVPPASKDRQFDGLSFFGGIVLTTCLMAIAAFSWKFYRQCKEGNYRTL
ncbi:integumentary mucin A.1-like [Temnothorax curvispinosus]|uniref:Integumentary mucin A.1-like n=1 Tax=Temnothorax curvispinosus TaxID=300111 RepID=A0A6J1QS86_9HYME|nr:integumentary mucin A.1-like [Temnothorax curvispinosus]